MERYIIIFQLGRPNPLEKVLVNAGYNLKYVYDFLDDVSFELTVDKNLINCQVKAIGFCQQMDIGVLYKRSIECMKKNQEVQNARR